MVWKIAANLKYFMKKCRQDKINAYAAQAAFFIILSIIPFLMVFSSLLQYTSVTESMLLDVMRRLIPEYLLPFFVSLVDEVYNRSMGIISVTAVIAIWSAAKGVQYLADGFNSVNDLEETRNWFVLRFWAVVYTAVFLAAIVIALVVLVFGNSLHAFAAQYLPFLTHLAEILFICAEWCCLCCSRCFLILSLRHCRTGNSPLRDSFPARCFAVWAGISFLPGSQSMSIISMDFPCTEA